MKISFWQHFPDLDDGNPIGLANALAAYQRKYDLDFIKTCPAGTWLASCYGAISAVIDDDSLGRRKILEPIIFDGTEWSSLNLFSDAIPKAMSEQVECIRELRRLVGPNTTILATVFCPFSQAIQIAGESTFIRHAENSPGALQTGMDVILENTLYSIRLLLEAGATGIYLVNQHLHTEDSVLNAYSKFGYSADLECLEQGPGNSFNLFHIHGAPTSLPHIPTLNTWRLHGNQLRLTQRPKLRSVISFSPEEMLKLKTESAIRNHIMLHYNLEWHDTIITPTCVLPLDFPEDVLLMWRSVVKTLAIDEK